MADQNLRLRERASSVSAAIGYWFYRLADRLEPPRGEMCPDCCEMTVPLADGSCPECIDRWKAQKRDEAIYGAGYEDAAREAEQRRDWEAMGW